MKPRVKFSNPHQQEIDSYFDSMPSPYDKEGFAEWIQKGKDIQHLLDMPVNALVDKRSV